MPVTSNRLRMLPQFLENAEADGAQSQQPDAQRAGAKPFGREHRAMAADDGCVVFAQSRDFERTRRSFLPKAMAFCWTTLPAMASASAKLISSKRLASGACGGIAVVDAVDVFDQAAARVELLSQEQRGQIRAAASEQRDMAVSGRARRSRESPRRGPAAARSRSPRCRR